MGRTDDPERTQQIVLTRRDGCAQRVQSTDVLRSVDRVPTLDDTFEFGEQVVRIGGAGIVPVIVTSLGDLYTGSKEATAQGLRFSASGLTQTVFSAIAGAVVAVGWRYPILLYSIAIPVAVAVHLWFDEPATTQNQSTNSDTTIDYNSKESTDSRHLFPFVTQRQILAILLACAIPPFVYFGFLTYNSIIVVASDHRRSRSQQPGSE